MWSDILLFKSNCSVLRDMRGYRDEMMGHWFNRPLIGEQQQPEAETRCCPLSSPTPHNDKIHHHLLSSLCPLEETLLSLWVCVYGLPAQEQCQDIVQV